MKIIFLCGSLEPGRDGVGDYVRRLGGELIRQGNEVAAIALNDRSIVEKIEGVQEANGEELLVLRLPFTWSVMKRFKLVNEWVEIFNPQFLSLQYVPFSFHSRGLPFGFSNLLLPLSKGRKWHIMFHELWLAKGANTSKKNLLIGYLQRKLIKQLILKLKPVVIHTQTHLSQARLLKLGFNTRYLPLFSNIPVVEKFLSHINTASIEKSKELSFVTFGSLYPNALIEPFAKEAAEYAKKNEVEISLTFIGRSGHEQKHWISVWESAGLKVNLLGEQTPERISEVLWNASVGISSTPLAMTEKSGSVAAMREHGLPVMCIAEHWQPSGFVIESLEGIIEYSDHNFETCVRSKHFKPSVNVVSAIAFQLLNDFATLAELII